MKLAQFLETYREAIADAVVCTYPPLYDAETRRTSGFDVRRLLRRPLGAQADAIRATALSLQRQSGTIVVGEMGSGKSTIAAAAAYLAGCRRVFVLAPPHLVRKWRREIEQTVPHARVAIVRTTQDLERARLLGGEVQFVVCSREQAKLSYRWAPAAVTRFVRDAAGQAARDEPGSLLRVHCCPTCFTPIVDDEGVPLAWADLAARRRRCEACRDALWQADRTGPRRVALADYVRARMPGYFDLLLIDECFPAGTQIATPSGSLPIEQLCVGDRVLSYRSGALVERTVVRTIRKRLRQPLVRVWHEGGSFTCTPNHRIYTAAGSILEARDLAPGTPLVHLDAWPACSANVGGSPSADHREAVRALPRGIPVLAAPEARAAVLRPRLCLEDPRRKAAPTREGAPPDHHEHLPVVWRTVRTAALQAARLLQQALRGAGTDGHHRLARSHRGAGKGEVSNPDSGFVSPDAANQRGPHGPSPYSGHPARADVLGRTWWEWIADPPAAGAPGTPGLVCGVLHPDGTQIVALRPGGPRGAGAEDRRGAGWSVAPDGETAHARSAEDGDAGTAWLDGPPVLERGGGSGRSGRGGQHPGYRTSAVLRVEWLTSDEEFVYDLEVEDTHRYFAEGVLVSNCHEYKARGSGQGLAAGALAEACPRTLVLTGTLLGGYSSTLFYLLYRFSPVVRAEFGYRDEAKWVGRYGYLARITKRDPDERRADGRHSRRRIYPTRIVEKPGVTPSILFHLIANTVFLRLRDVARDLPPFEERVVLVPLEAGSDPGEPAQQLCYRKLAADLRAAVQQALRAGSKRLLGTYLQALLAYPDACSREETVLDPHTLQVLAHAPALPENHLYPKERALLELVRRERARGRRMLVYLTHTGTRDISPRVRTVLEQAGFRVAVLKADTTAADRREEWVAARVREGVDVLVTNPRLVQTGLDLVDFPSIAWLEVDYSVYVLRQASRRSWRIGQRHPVEVSYFAYEGTLQADALGLVAAKTRASLMVEGELPEEGLAALGGDGGDVYLALARKLAEPAGQGVDGQSLEALFAEARREEVADDALLAPGAWDDDAEALPEPLPFPVPATSPAPGPVVDLPLFGPPAASDSGPALPASGGKVVTFEELARLVGRRTARRRVVPEQQLLLFAS